MELLSKVVFFFPTQVAPNRRTSLCILLCSGASTLDFRQCIAHGSSKIANTMVSCYIFLHFIYISDNWPSAPWIIIFVKIIETKSMKSKFCLIDFESASTMSFLLFPVAENSILSFCWCPFLICARTLLS